MLVQSFNIRERTLHFAPGLTRKDFDDLNAPGKSARELTETVAKVHNSRRKAGTKNKAVGSAIIATAMRLFNQTIRQGGILAKRVSIWL